VMRQRHVRWNTAGILQASILRVYITWGRFGMFKATVEIATDIAHDLNVSRELVWEIIRGMRYDSIEELEIAVCKALT
jgi:hypothetical protein